jgi:hypothetical protein
MVKYTEKDWRDIDVGILSYTSCSPFNKKTGMRKAFGWDKNWQVYRYLLKGEKTRGLVIQNPKKINQKMLTKLRTVI